jgi:hypothetical protein
MTVMSLVKGDGRRCSRVGVVGAQGACVRQWALWLSKRRLGVGRGWGRGASTAKEKETMPIQNDPKADADAGTAEGVGSQECVGEWERRGPKNGGHWALGNW